jgi:hypothetical protein
VKWQSKTSKLARQATRGIHVIFFYKIKEKKLLLCTERPVLQPHLAAVALPAPRGRDGVLAAALEAYLEEQPALLSDLFLCCVRYWHLLMMQEKALLYVSTI